MTNTKVVSPSGKRKPPAAGMGRRKGSVNANTKELKDMILAALSGVGGTQYLMDCAMEPKTAAAFLGLIGKVLPMTVAGDPNAPMKLVVSWET